MAPKLADQIRGFVFENYVKPAREAGETQITVRAGQIHSAMGLKGRMPAVCGALGTELFEQEFGVRKLDVTGPGQGSSTTFVFAV